MKIQSLMRYKFTILFTLIAGLLFGASTQTDTIFNPPVIFSGVPRTYEIAGIEVTGAPNYEDHIILQYSGLKEGQSIDIPGQEVNNAVRRLMRQGLFSQAQVKVVFGNPIQSTPWVITRRNKRG